MRNLEKSWLDNLISNELTDGAKTVAVGREFQGGDDTMSERKFR